MIEVTALIDSLPDENGMTTQEPHKLLLNLEEVNIVSIVEIKEGCVIKFNTARENGNILVRETYEFLRQKLFGD